METSGPKVGVPRFPRSELIMKSYCGPHWSDMVLSVFRAETPERVVWQPRLEYWFWVHQKQGTLPKRYQGTTLLDLYDDLGCSVRYFVEPLRIGYEKVKACEDRVGDKLARTWQTPVGELREVLQFNWFGLSSQVVEHAVKTPQDLRTLEYIREDATYAFDSEGYESAVARVGNRGVPQFYYRRSPLQSLLIDDMGLEATVYALSDCPDAVEHFIEAATRADDRMYEVLLSSPVPILNLGENTDSSLDAPSMLERYLLPYYRKRTAQIKAAGKFCHIHMDGSLKRILRYMHDAAWDGIESPTPIPQGDVTLEELKEAMGDLILLDGLPALYFLPQYSESDLAECVKTLVRLFHPRLILGISGSLPPEGDVEKVRFVSQLLSDELNCRVGKSCG
jgi:hypothetical protein